MSVYVMCNKNDCDNVSKVYSAITDGVFNDITDSAEDVINEFKFCYKNIAELAFDLEDKFDEIFEDCETKDDFKNALNNYFGWDNY